MSNLLRRIAGLLHRDVFWLLLLPVVGVRSYTIYQLPLTSSSIFYGFASDIVVTGFLTAAVALLRHRKASTALYLLIPILSYLVYWNYEHILANGSNISVLHLGQAMDTVFIKGSLMNPLSPGLLLALIALALTSSFMILRNRLGARGTAPEMILFLGSMLVVLVSGQSRLIDGWRAYNFVEENIFWLSRSQVVRDDNVVSKLPEQLIVRNQLGGEPFLAFPESPASNVLIIILEGISGHMVVPGAGRLRRDSTIPNLENLNRIAKQSLRYTQFVNTQRQTNRGQYALLCGDLPKLTKSEPKMVQYARSGGPPCLPRILADEGYETTYMQSAPLSYMYKSDFMPRAGFKVNLGDKDYAESRTRGMWGVDDKTLFQEARKVIAAQTSPWMLTLLTVGTHHPYTIPDMEPGSKISFKTAAESMDEYLGAFWSYLDESGTLDNTLVLITSDESVGQAISKQPLLSQAWGFLVISAPGDRRPRVVKRLFSQTDIAVSVLDYLGIDERARFRGRSVFREYHSAHWVLFGNVYLHQFALVKEGESVVLCSENLGSCSEQAIQGPSLFNSLLRKPISRAVAESDLLLMRDVLAWNEVAPDEPSQYGVDLEAHVNFPPGSPGWRLLTGGQSLSIPAGSHVEVRLTLAATGTIDGRAALTVQLRKSDSSEVYLQRQVEELSTHKPIRVEMEYQFETSIEGVELAVFAQHRTGGTLMISTKGSLTITPAHSNRKPSS